MPDNLQHMYFKKKVIQKTVEATVDLIGNKNEENIT